MGIKSFQGSRKSQQLDKDDSFSRVRDYMSKKLITFRPKQSVEEVIEILLKSKISGGPVVNENNELIGIISEGDCIKFINESRYYNSAVNIHNVEKHMVTNVETIDANMNVFDAANKFLQSKRRRFPIVEDGKLIGQISQKDILRASMDVKQQKW